MILIVYLSGSNPVRIKKNPSEYILLTPEAGLCALSDLVLFCPILFTR